MFKPQVKPLVDWTAHFILYEPHTRTIDVLFMNGRKNLKLLIHLLP